MTFPHPGPHVGLAGVRGSGRPGPHPNATTRFSTLRIRRPRTTLRTALLRGSGTPPGSPSTVRRRRLK
ncbi:conserved hypothetical protein [Streptomyces pristinaespiralis ATCC 25486]|uniref:Uncharacterized protein n=1 Tax=Streptomyces pristinaespiralis (strain ATCC 25486 / DSM 40338 / CBS 914.69 / JCM 4507 / KCC S-0507 / NBRC 13074 / NRRL 2958 / 5647) TaxID=457429 RepID=B5H545_STRE2|nr:conserved hypothetical protein [Streptomyces pristinaespiralis ATCC 25486]